MPKKGVKRKFSKVQTKTKISQEEDSESLISPKKKSIKKKTTEKNKGKKEKTCDSVRNKQLYEANEEEDKNIRRLENILNMKKKKNKKLPSVFKEDGLDYLLDVIDHKEDAPLLSDDSMDIEEDFAIVRGKSSKTDPPTDDIISSSRPIPKQRTLTQLLEEKEGKSANGEDSSSFSGDDDGVPLSEDDDLSEDGFSENSNNYSGSDDDDDEEMMGDDETEKVKDTSKPKVWEDIYGRFRDETGNVLKSQEVTKYVPPKLRVVSSKMDEKSEDYMKIRKNLKGLLNRLSQSNLQNICHQIEELYMKHSRNDMNEALFSLMADLVFTTTLTPPRLIMEQAMLIVLLHANIGSEVGAYFLQRIVEKLGTMFKDLEIYNSQEKELNNLLTFLSHLYNFKVTHCTLMFDIFKIFTDSFQAKDIELIQLLLKNIGFVLRKDDPLKLKELILSIQAKAATFNKDQNETRVNFMLETLTAIRNNNMYKIPDYDPSIVEHAKKMLKVMIRKGCSIQELAITYEDLLKADERGRWWIVGSAWQNTPSAEKDVKSETPVLPKTEVSDKILSLARQQHMNTEVRKSIFCILMTAEDYMDAFEKLLKQNLKNQQEREIIHVIIHCALKEKNYNAYYSYLAEKFCGFARKHMMCLQFALWDKFKELSNLKQRELNNLSRFLSHLFISGALPLSVLKVIHFSEMDKTMVKFFRQILLAILLHDSEEVCASVFSRIAQADSLKLLRESLRLFMLHFVLRNNSKLEPDVALKLEERVKMAERALKPPKRVF